jgi:hypothetical protein
MPGQTTSSERGPATPLRQWLRDALTTAIKARDRVAAAALRSTLAAIDNAEAVDRPESMDRDLSLGKIPTGAGATDVARRVLTEQQVEQIVRSELADRRVAARAYDEAGQVEHAGRLRNEISVISRCIDVEAEDVG